MSLGIKKCGVAHIRGGVVVTRGPVKLRKDLSIGEIPLDGVYRYLGVAQLVQGNRQHLQRESP